VTGAQGSTQAGVVGAIGRAGEAGPQGPVGATGARGPVGAVKRWMLFRDFQFGYNSSVLRSSEMDKVLVIARYVKQNPSIRIAIDSSPYTSYNKDLSDRRSRAIRDALMKYGVQSADIQMGSYGNQKILRDDRTAVLFGSVN
jgi:outer membrane protein OmpA-like peptidoglycan-associated protein